MTILDAKIEHYLTELSPERDAVLKEMETIAKDRNFPIVGPLVGMLCYQMAKAIGAKRIFEMGSGFGYSAYWLASALPEGGELYFTELSHDNLKIAKDYFQQSELLKKIKFRQGDALEIIQQTEGQFDLILNDVDKEDYPAALELIVPRLRKGGMLITDNLLWHGSVVETNPERSTQAVLKYTKNLYNSKALWTTIIPLRDGVGLSLKMS